MSDQGALFGDPQDLRPWQTPDHVRRRQADDLPAAKRARDDAMRRVEEHAEEEWKVAALAAIHRTARERPEFIVNDVWAYVSPPREPRAVGPLMKRAQSLGWIAPTNEHRQTPNPRAHARPMRVWRSLVYREAA